MIESYEVWFQLELDGGVLADAAELDCVTLPAPSRFVVYAEDGDRFAAGWPLSGGRWRLVIGEDAWDAVLAEKFGLSRAAWNRVLLLSIDRDEAWDELDDASLVYLERGEEWFDAAEHAAQWRGRRVDVAYVQVGLTDDTNLFGLPLEELYALDEGTTIEIPAADLTLEETNFEGSMDSMLVVHAED